MGSAWRVRLAAKEDLPSVTEAVGELLFELAGSEAASHASQSTAQALIEHEAAGVLLIAQARDGSLVGVLGASWQLAMRIPGPYGLIQELWVDRAWRRRAVGASLVDALCELARGRGVARIEVGLPGEGFAGLPATSAFYERNGFAAIGTRMRRSLR